MQVHPSQISPGESFDIFYFIRNHTDATTYYIRAKVYDVRTGELLATHTLTQSSANTRLWIKTIDAPPDPVGYGRNIVAIATVYTDSGYTTTSENYEEQEQYYLIKAAPLQLGGGGVDYRALREMMEEVVEKKLEALPEPTKETDLAPVLKALKDICHDLKDVPRKGYDPAPILEQITSLRGAIEGRPQFEKTDLSGVDGQLSTLSEGLKALVELPDTMRADVQTELKAGLKQVQKLLELYLEEFAEGFSEKSEKALEKAAKNVNLSFSIPLQSGGGKTQREEAPDLSHLYGA